MNKCKTTKRKKIRCVVVMCLLAALLLTSCGKAEPPVFLDFLNADGGYDISGDYDLKEIDLAALGIKMPGGICVYNDSIYVCDISNNCIVKLNKDLVKEAAYGTLGMEEGNFSEPRDIVFAGDCFYVLDSGNDRVQKFTSDFQYLEEYYLGPLHSKMGFSRYISIAVDKKGVIYVSTNAADVWDAYIYRREDGSWDKLGEEAVGYLCAGEGNIYFANLFEFKVEEKKTSMGSGENSLYMIQNGKLKPLVQIRASYAPTALTYQDGCFYMISFGYKTVNRLSVQEETFDTLLALPMACPYMYMEVDAEGNLYISDSENGCFYVAEKQ